MLSTLNYAMFECPAGIDRLIRKLGARRIELHFVELKDSVRDKLRRFKMMDLLQDTQFDPTIGSSVDDYPGDQAVDTGPAPSGET